MHEPSPPKWADRFLEWYCNPKLLEAIQGDAYEIFYRTIKNRSRPAANFLFIWNVLRFFRWSNIKRSSTPSPSIFMMYRNYFTVFKRGFVKQKGYSFLNVFGLAIGIACFLLISLYIRDEYSFDKMHSKSDRIYRIHEIFQSDGVGERSASQPFPVAEALLNDYESQILKVVRFFNFQAPSLALATVDNKKEFHESRLFAVDSTIFDVFDFKLVEGDPKKALADPLTIVLTKSMAKKYFEDENPMGKFLKFQGTQNMLVTGILEDVPPNTHFQFDFLISFASLDVYDPGVPQRWHWYWNPCWTYLLMKDQAAAREVQAGMPAFVQKYFPDYIRDDVTMELMPLHDIHLKSRMDYEIQPNSSLTTVYVFASIAIFVLLIACINFINLSTARAAKRAKEVGMRKTLGGQKLQLIGQFLFESIMLCLISVIIAIILVAGALPFFNAFAEKNIVLSLLLKPFYISLLVGLPLAVGVLAGVYPAFVLSSFKPIIALKGNAGSAQKGVSFRKALVVVQFSLSIILLIGTGVAIDQLDMLQRSDTGFDRENVILIPVSQSPIAKSFLPLRNEIERNSNVISVTAMEEILGAKHQVGNYLIEGMEVSKPFPRLMVRHDFLKTFDIPLVAGRDYSEDIKSDDSLALVVNETFVRQMGWKSNEEAIGKRFGDSADRRIVGVVKDFNFTSRHQPIRPLVLDLNTQDQAFQVFIKYMAVRISDKNMSETIAWIEKEWKEQVPGWPFGYFFLENDLQKLYKAESKMSKITLIFSSISIFVACLGLFGLSTFTAEQRRKEMSIRKVLGSSDSEIFVLFSKHFFSLILIANVVAFPLAYFVMKKWLASFAYQVNIDFTLFLLAGAAAIVIALLTIAYQALRAAHTNPAEVLKNE